MSLNIVTDKLLTSIKNELDNEKNIHYIEHEILQPLIHRIITNLYPYFIGFSLLIMSMFIFIMIILVLNIKILFK